MKAYTDIHQSKKLAEILPLESADMRIGNYIGEYGKVDETNIHYYSKGESFGAPEIIPCWSLAALLSVLPNVICLDTHYTSLNIYPTENLGWIIEYSNVTGIIDFSFNNKNLIDACYEMIIKLHEIKML